MFLKRALYFSVLCVGPLLFLYKKPLNYHKLHFSYLSCRLIGEKMPKTKKSRIWSSDNMAKAIEALRAKKIGLKKANKTFNVPRSTLQRLAKVKYCGSFAHKYWKAHGFKWSAGKWVGWILSCYGGIVFWTNTYRPAKNGFTAGRKKQSQAFFWWRYSWMKVGQAVP